MEATQKAQTAVAAADHAQGIPDRTAVRDLLKRNKPEDIARAKSKSELIEMAGVLGGIDIDENKMTKPQIVEAMIKVANLPNPALRGKSSTEEPVSYVWQRCDELAAAATKEKPMPRRKDVIAMLQKEGIAFYTARTQYQAWFAATQKGTKRLSSLPNDALPASMRAETEETEA